MGTDGVMTVMPQTKFEYQNDVTINRPANINVVSGQIYLDYTGDAKPEYLSVTSGAPYGSSWRIIDKNGDYMPDMYYSVSAQTTCNGYCNMQPAISSLKINNGNSNFTTSVIDGNSLPVSAAYDPVGSVYDLTLNIADVNAGTYAQLVEAAENCQVSVIHPGKPRNPKEPGIEELLKRAEAFR
jgi:hypothetical protein